MSATSAPFGFRPAFHPSGLDRNTQMYIAAGYGTQINEGMPVILNTNGTVTAGTGAADLIGIFMGCEYVDATGKPNVSRFWPAGQTVLAGTQPVAWVNTDPATVYEVQADGSVALTAIGDQGDVTNVAAATSFGTSQCTFASALAGAGVQGQFRIVGFSQALDNAIGDAFTVVQVQIARHQFVSSKAAI